MLNPEMFKAVTAHCVFLLAAASEDYDTRPFEFKRLLGSIGTLIG